MEIQRAVNYLLRIRGVDYAALKENHLKKVRK